MAAFQACAQPSRGWYDEAKLAAMRTNLEHHDWARKDKARILKAADAWTQYDDARLRTLVTPPAVPRAVVAHVTGAPVDGEALNKIGRYSWIVSFDHPYKVRSPVDGTLYPSNDFVAFMKTGYKDRSLLTGPYADDGWGATVPGHDKPFWFVGVYAHWSAVRLLLPAIENLSKAYLLTDDPTYAHACGVLLWQLAEYYPDYWYKKQSRYAKEVMTNYPGRLLYHTWESLYTCQTVPIAYDAIKPTLDTDEALQTMTGQTGEQLLAHIENRILRTMAGDIMDGSGRIAGNYGMHQYSLLLIAAALKNSAPGTLNSPEMIDWILHNPKVKAYTAMGMMDAVNNLLHRDGYPFESPSYNCHWMIELGRMGLALRDEVGPVLKSSRYRKLFAWPMQMTVAGEFTPPYGDSNHMFAGKLGWSPKYLGGAYRVLRDPRIAKAILASGSRGVHDLFAEDLDAEIAKAGASVKDPLGVTSELLPGVGFASLQCGSDANRTGLALFYGYYAGHKHADRLQLDIFSWRNPLLPDLGYPETADSFDPRRYGFISHTVAHNTVMINEKTQDSSPKARGRLHVFAPGTGTQLVETSSEGAYPGVAELYRRTLMLVEVTPTQAFIVDIFRVRGGSQHDYLAHGNQAEFTGSMPFSEPRKVGTLAGADVAYGDFYDDDRYADNNKAHVPYYLYRGSAFQWLFNVQQTPLNGVGTVDWRLNRPETLFPKAPRAGVVLRAHLVGDDETVFACDGIPQRRKTWPETLKWVVRRRVGDELESVFVTVYEPYKDTPFIQSVKRLPVRVGNDLPVALEVTCAEKTFVVFNRIESGPSRPSTLALPGAPHISARAAVLERASGHLWQLDPASTPAFRMTVAAVDLAAGTVTLTTPMPADLPPAGGYAIVESDGHANAIPFARRMDDQTFSVGDDDLSTATLRVVEAQEQRLSFTPTTIYFVEPGMTVVNEAGRAVARIQAAKSGVFELDRVVTAADFPDIDGDGQRSFRVTVVGPGDTIVMHRTVTAKVTP